MEHLSLSAITIGYEKITISRARLDKTLIHTNQASASIDRRDMVVGNSPSSVGRPVIRRVLILYRTKIMALLRMHLELKGYRIVYGTRVLMTRLD